MSRAHHRRQGFLPARPVGGEFSIRPDAPAASKTKRGARRPFRRKLMRGGAIHLIYSRCAKGLANSSRAIAALCQRPRLGLSVKGIIDQPAARKPFHELFDLRRSVPLPAALPYLPVKIDRQL